MDSGKPAMAQDAKSARELLGLFKKPIEDSKKLFAEQRKQQQNVPANQQIVGVPPSNIPLMTAWVEAFTKFNAGLGKTIFDLQGADDRAKFVFVTKSLNKSLNRAETLPFDEACIGQVDKMITKAVGDAYSVKPAAAGLAGVAAGASVQAQAPQTVPPAQGSAGPVGAGAIVPKKSDQPESKQAATKPKETAKPGGEEKTAPETKMKSPLTGEALSDQERRDMAALSTDLKDISNIKSTRGKVVTKEMRSDAERIYRELNKILSNKKQKQDEAEKARTLYADGSSIRDAAQTRLEAANAQVDPKALDKPVYKSVEERINAIRGSFQELDKPTADTIKKLVEDIWFCSDEAMIKNLDEIESALVGLKDKSGTAESRQKYAQARFDNSREYINADQATTKLQAEMAIGLFDSAVSSVRSSTLPEKDELIAAETADGIPTTKKEADKKYGKDIKMWEMDRYLHATAVKVPGTNKTVTKSNTKTDIAAELESRKTVISDYMKSHKKLSFHAVSALYYPVIYETRAVAILLDGWSKAKATGLDSAATDVRQKFYGNYSLLSDALSKPGTDLFDRLPKHVKSWMIDELRSVSMGIKVSENDLVLLARNKFRQNKTFEFGVLTSNFLDGYSTLDDAKGKALTPAQTVAADKLADLSFLQGKFEADFKVYLLDQKVYVEGGKPITGDLKSNSDFAQKLELSLGYLHETIQKSGLGTNDPVIKSVLAWEKWTNDHKANMGKEDLSKLANILYSQSLGIITISKAEVLHAESSIRSSSLTRDRVNNAKSTIELARWVFDLNFSRADNGATFYPVTQYPLLPKDIADQAINVLSPPVYLSTSDFAYSTQLTYYNALKRLEPADAEKNSVNAAREYYHTMVRLKDEANFGTSALFASGGKYSQSGYLLYLADPRARQKINANTIPAFEGPSRPTESRVDLLFDEGEWHEPAELRSLVGRLPYELVRETREAADPKVPEILRRFDSSGYFSSMYDITIRMGSTPPAQSARGANELYIADLDERSTGATELVLSLKKRLNCNDEQELMAHLDSLVKNKDATAPQAELAIRGLKSLWKARELRTSLAAKMGANHFDSSVASGNTDHAIKLAQAAEVFLADKSLEKITAKEHHLEFYPTIERLPPVENTVTARLVNLRMTVDGKEEKLDAYLTEHPDMTIRYHWFWFVKKGDNEYLRNPKYNSRDPNSPLFAGMVVRTARGGTVVRVKKQDDGSYSPIVDSNNRVKPEDVLYYVQTDLKPKVDTAGEANALWKSLRATSITTKEPSSWIPLTEGTITPVMMPLQRKKTHEDGAHGHHSDTTAPVSSGGSGQGANK